MMIVFMAAMLAGCAKGNEAAKSPEELYRDAVRDAAFADDDEILPLVSLVESNPMTTWQDGKVLLLTWHNYPDSYPDVLAVAAIAVANHGGNGRPRDICAYRHDRKAAHANAVGVFGIACGLLAPRRRV